jgi:hypothetical protein
VEIMVGSLAVTGFTLAIFTGPPAGQNLIDNTCRRGARLIGHSDENQ